LGKPTKKMFSLNDFQLQELQYREMGFKIRAGMAVGGFVLSYFFGLGFLSGIASHLDTTGNILVDIADGIGLVSKVKFIFFKPNFFCTLYTFKIFYQIIPNYLYM
jgi:hypothetical protein